ncbi:MAG: outer membrane protein transport protein [Bacteroidaceae bacterium]|nr:outer membrane protein transport protein [Bacteroidaceae bacterium]
MKRKLVMAASALLFATNSFAGGYLTNTNQNAAFGRNLSQEAQIDITSTYANPAGVGFLTPGWHFALNNQSAWQTRTAESWFVHPQQGPFAQGYVNGLNNSAATKEYKGTATAPIIPSFDLAYVHDRWSLAFHFGVVGGGGKCEFKNGLGSFESKVAMLPSVLNAFAGTTAAAGYAMDTYMRGKQYYFGGQLNGSYKATDNLNIALGLRAVYASSNYYGYVRDMKVVTPTGAQVPVRDAMAPLVTQLATAVPQLAPVMESIAGVAGDVNLNCDQKGWGITPIIGVDWRINDHWNLAAKYEFKTRMRLENESGESASASALAQLDEYADGKKVAADLPAILYLGAQYSPIKQVRINAGAHVFFDKQATQYNHREKELQGQTWELAAGAEYDINKVVTVSAGWQSTNYGLGDNSKYISDMSFVCSSNSVGLGARFHVSKHVALDVSYFKTLYKHYDRYQTDYNGIKQNFGTLLTQVGGSVAQIAQGIAAEDVAAGINPQDDPRMAVFNQLNSAVAGVSAVEVPGNDHLHRTNDVLGIGVIVNF